MVVKIKKLVENAVIPHYAHPTDAGLDLTAISFEHKDGIYIYGTGLAVEIPEGYVGLIFPRSSIYKQDLQLVNSVGVIDANYRGEIKFMFKSYTPEFGYGEEDTKIYQIGDRVGQMIILPYPKINLVEVEELSNTDRGEGGFGSTGK